jgi:endonuclease/exonuclease/phosphatase (EEP) superfamily protein YafD
MTHIEQAEHKSSTLSKKKRKGLDVWGLLSASLFLVGLVTVTGFFSKFWWPCDVVSAFRLQYVELALLAAVVYGFGRRRRQLVSALVIAGVNAALIVPMFFGGGVKPKEPTLRLLLSNVKTDNTEYGRLLELVRLERPDIIILEEVNQDWIDALGEIRAAYPHYLEYPESDNFGIAVYSRLPVRSLEVKMLGEIKVASIHAELEHDGATWHILGTHPVPPSGKDYWQWRNDQLSKMADYLRGLDGHVVLIGDLNMTQWSHYFGKLERDSGLRDGSKGSGLSISWPAFFPPLGIPIDHCFVSAGIGVCDRRTGKSVGSDHFPVVVDLAPIGQGDGD